MLIECSSPYNIPILRGRKGPNKWRLVPPVPNPYSLLDQIHLRTAYCYILDLKDAFFCIYLHPKSQPIFAFEDPTGKTKQVTWTVLSQGFRDSPHLFGLTLTQDFTELQYPQATLLQYVDDFLKCGPTKPVIL
jgi:hypothetical protein